MSRDPSRPAGIDLEANEKRLTPIQGQKAVAARRHRFMKMPRRGVAISRGQFRETDEKVRFALVPFRATRRRQELQGAQLFAIERQQLFIERTPQAREPDGLRPELAAGGTGR